MNFLRGMATGLTGCILFFILPLLGLGIMINVTLLNPNFIETEVEKLEITEVAREIITDQIPPEDFAYISGIEDTLIEIKPWANEQAGNIIKGVYDYLLGKAEEIRVTIDMDPLRESLATNLTEVYLENPPEGFDQLPVSEQHQTAADFKQQVAEIIPSAVEFNEEFWAGRNEHIEKCQDDSRLLSPWTMDIDSSGGFIRTGALQDYQGYWLDSKIFRDNLRFCRNFQPDCIPGYQLFDSAHCVFN